MFIKKNEDNFYDVIVVGAGHAGIEASLAAARMGLRTAVITINLDNIGQMSCNPAIGGLAKGHLVREVDALGGEMGRAIDRTGIQFRTLNTRKGPAVRSSRAQADMFRYKTYMKTALESEYGLTIIQSMVDSLIIEQRKVSGVVLWAGERLYSSAVILTTGTFLKGLVHIGLFSYNAGRAGDFAADKLSLSLIENGFELGRLKTGTTPRLDGRTIDFSRLEEQKGEDDFIPFSIEDKKISNSISCYMTYTNEKTHNIVLNDLDKSPLYCGVIKGVGPRYCPSIEDKVVRFKDKERHQVFLERESLDSVEYYPNGLSTSLPLNTQLKFLRTIEGLKNVNIMRSGYAIEYDYVLPTQLKHSLETKIIENLFLAGQINGTSGYEEAAAQGIIAGINAVLKIKGEAPLILRRDDAYIGVLIDDLIVLGTNEPYRMFTSRAEYRLLLREDNADFRLCEYGKRIGLLGEERYSVYKDRLFKFNELLSFLKTYENGKYYNMLKRPDFSVVNLEAAFNTGIGTESNHYDTDILNRVKLFIKYEGYINRQREEIDRLKKFENVKLDKDIDFKVIPGLSLEVVEKLNKIKPETVAEAGRISGVTPAAVGILLMRCRKS
ncbi:tRNA uridine-5-carboxymethylaminomethyl(34) synthesis enzyme MnmG [Candidatus Acidulodesulfobacterium sp. H_13]|uniref:tRNA uridine-5-carboxymethylaminomethyl(34) synthesis enzyme MnmG n=1 Tax=Candidatus Acidulodesulfobacterium sp. H_13 TaxID=3395470 RepID=UPI003AF902F6